MKLMLSTGSVAGHGTEKTMQLASKLGFDGVEIIMPVRGPSPGEVRAMRKKHGFSCMNVHMPFLKSVLPLGLLSPDPAKKMLERAVAWAGEACAEKLVVHPFPAIFMRKKFSAAMADVLPSCNMRFCVENMEPRVFGTFPYCLRSPAELRKFAEENDTGITFDTAHCMKYGRNPAEMLAELGQHVENIHLSGFRRGMCHMELFSNMETFTELFSYLKKAKYRGRLVLEIMPSGEEDIKKNVAFVKNSLGF
jgi:sugar phosphate isomerase/epimerase